MYILYTVVEILNGNYLKPKKIKYTKHQKITKYGTTSFICQNGKVELRF